MCRYAFHNYRDHFACFDCRKAFKYWQWQPVSASAFTARQELAHIPRDIVCPDCSQPMVDMGLDFKAPRKRDVEQWEILRALQEHGFTFHGCGCYVNLQLMLPQTLREVPEWLEQHRPKSEGERLLDSFGN